MKRIYLGIAFVSVVVLAFGLGLGVLFGLVFVLALMLAVVVSLLAPQTNRNLIETHELSYETSTIFNVASLGVGAILIALYATWW